jgi:hypothetical protein
MKRHEEDTRAILARREAFVKSVLSKNEIDTAKGGSIGICLSIYPCLSPAATTEIFKIPEPCLSPALPIDINEPQICLSPA